MPCTILATLTGEWGENVSECREDIRSYTLDEIGSGTYVGNGGIIIKMHIIYQSCDSYRL